MASRSDYQWPLRPYVGLDPYGPSDLGLFAGRDEDISSLSVLLGRFGTRVVLLHGSAGCGKTSVLRAGVIPFLSMGGYGFRFHVKRGRGGASRPVFVRSSENPLQQLGEAVYEFASSGLLLQTPRGSERVELRFAVQDCRTAAEFRDRLVQDPTQLVDALRAIARTLPCTLVLVLDQAEEVLSLEPGVGGDQGRHALSDFIRSLCESPIDLRLVISLRTEFLGRFRHEMRLAELGATALCEHYLRPLEQADLSEAIMRPTCTEPVGDYGVPWEHYRFSFEPGLPDRIAADLLALSPVGGALPVLQIVCGRLHTKMQALQTGSSVITHALFDAHGGVQGQIEAHIGSVLVENCRRQGLVPQEAEAEADRWKRVLVSLVRQQSDNSVVSAYAEEERLREVAAESGCISSFDAMLRSLCDGAERLCRRVASVRDGARNAAPRYCLAHDAIGMALNRWRESTLVPRRRTEITDEGEMVDRILARQCRAEEVLVVNSSTLEASQHPRAEEFQRAMFASLLEGRGRYTFIMSAEDRRAAVRHWHETLQGLATFRHLDISAPGVREEVLKELERLEDQGRLMVRGVEASTCIIRLVAFDPGRPELCEIYVWDWWRDGGQIVNDGAFLSPWATRRWIEDLYVPRLVVGASHTNSMVRLRDVKNEL